MKADNTLIIGAGPFGLSASAHLRELGVGHRVVGRPLDTWRAHMPAGMNLKSEPYASALAAPRPGYDVGDYCRTRGLDFAPRIGPLSLERFLNYADWYAAQLVPEVSDITVSDISATGDGFTVSFADADPVSVRQVVVATGVLPYARVPAELAQLPADLVSHSSDHHSLERFRGRRVAVLGAGQSALETAALLTEAGADPVLIVRRPGIRWVLPNPEHVSTLGRLRRPVTNLCEGWRCAIWDFPELFRLLPENVRVEKVATVLGPSGSAWLKDRVHGVVETLTSHRVVAAEPAGSGVRLQLDGPQRSSVQADHVIAATGFRVDLARLSFLPAQLREHVQTVNGYPIVSRSSQSSVPGLYFTGVPAAVSLGPSMRFIAGTHNVTRHIARSVARRDRRHPAIAAADKPLEVAAE